MINLEEGEGLIFLSKDLKHDRHQGGCQKTMTMMMMMMMMMMMIMMAMMTMMIMMCFLLPKDLQHDLLQGRGAINYDDDDDNTIFLYDNS